MLAGNVKARGLFPDWIIIPELELRINISAFGAFVVTVTGYWLLEQIEAHPEIIKMVELSASRFKGKPEPSSEAKMLGQDPPDFVPKEK